MGKIPDKLAENLVRDKNCEMFEAHENFIGP